MNRAQYEAMLHTEDRYWWFRGRRKVISRFLSQMGLGENPDILEVGCGGGGNLLMLSRFSRHIKAVEPNPVLREHALQRDICEVAEGTLPDNIPFKGKKFDLICLFDVLEHIENDWATAIALRGRLTDTGRILVTVPANPSLWSIHDEENMHFRRYTKSGLIRLFEKAGLKVERISFFNFFLFPPIWLYRKLGGPSKKSARTKPDIEKRLFGLSGLFYSLMLFESVLLSKLNLPFGVSLICVAKKR